MDKFKEAFDKALIGGEGFSAAANNCLGSYMAQFDEACAGIQKIFYPISFDINRLKLEAQTSIIAWKGRECLEKMDLHEVDCMQ